MAKDKSKFKKMDTHLHSNASDAENYCTPDYRFGMAMGIGMDYFTLTDHDTMDGILSVYETFKEEREKIVLGVEFTAENLVVHEQDYHVLDVILGKRKPWEIKKKITLPFTVHYNILNLTEKDFENFKAIKPDTKNYKRYIQKAREDEKRVILMYRCHPWWFYEEERKLVKKEDVLVSMSNEDILEINGDDSLAINSDTARYIKANGKAIVGGSDSHNKKIAEIHTIATGGTKEEFLENIIMGKARIGQYDWNKREFSELKLDYRHWTKRALELIKRKAMRKLIE